MTPNRRDNICCGGGGGTVSMDELRPYRTLVGGKAKAEQIRATGAKYCVAPCANCKKQLRELMEDQGSTARSSACMTCCTRRSTSNQGAQMEAWIEFGRGPLFRIAFSLMLLGLLRAVALTAIGIAEAYRRSPDKIVNWREVRRQTFAWLFPVNATLARSGQSTARYHFLFHVGILLVPPFLFAHVLLWKRSAGFAWFAIPQALANYLTVLVNCSRHGFVSRPCAGLGSAQDEPACRISPGRCFWWFLSSPASCARMLAIGPKTYQSLMLLHVYSANLIMLLIPFTKIAHCVLAPLSQIVTAIAWKFPAGAGDRVAATLGYADRPTWMPKARLEICDECVHERGGQQMKVAILTDTTKCNNCHECVAACKKQNQLAAGPAAPMGSR